MGDDIHRRDVRDGLEVNRKDAPQRISSGPVEKAVLWAGRRNFGAFGRIHFAGA
jgi:hypothetical protein